MSTSNSIRHAVRYALLTSAAAAAAGPAYAADPTIQEVVVTGSRIAQPNLETTSPVTQVTAEDVVTQGVTQRSKTWSTSCRRPSLLRTPRVANGATGTATVNLRGLGSPRTLVLVDGRRMPYGGVSSASAAADLNQIPAAMVERVEVLTGGASAVYGSDAIAGVVNFIMKKDFEGVQFDGQYGLYQHNNDFGGPGAVKLRDVIAGRAATNPTQFQLPDDNVTDGNGVAVQRHDGREHRRRPRQHHRLRGVAATTSRSCSETATTRRARSTRTRRCRSPAAAPARPSPGTSRTSARTQRQRSGRHAHADDVRTPIRCRVNSRSTATTSGRSTTRPTSTTSVRSNHYQRPDTRYSLGAMGHYELAPSSPTCTRS